MAGRAQVQFRAPEGSVGRRIDDLREARGLTRWGLWRAMQAAGYRIGKLKVYRTLTGKTKASAELAAAAAEVLGIDAEGILFGIRPTSVEEMVHAQLAVQPGRELASRVEARSAVGDAYDRDFLDALRATLRGVRTRGDGELAGRYAKAASLGIYRVLSQGPPGSGRLAQRMDVLVGFARSAYLQSEGADAREYGQLVRAAAEHLCRAEAAWLKRSRDGEPKAAWMQRDAPLEVIGSAWRVGYLRFAAQTLEAFLLPPPTP